MVNCLLDNPMWLDPPHVHLEGDSLEKWYLLLLLACQLLIIFIMWLTTAMEHF